MRWIDLLDDEDLGFLKRFVLASGSLKELADAYGVSYPTIRLRLDRLIAKVKIYDAQKPMSAFERTARGMLADGRIDAATLRTLLDAHRRETQTEQESQHDSPHVAGPNAADPSRPSRSR